MFVSVFLSSPVVLLQDPYFTLDIKWRPNTMAKLFKSKQNKTFKYIGYGLLLSDG